MKHISSYVVAAAAVAVITTAPAHAEPIATPCSTPDQAAKHDGSCWVFPVTTPEMRAQFESMLTSVGWPVTDFDSNKFNAIYVCNELIVDPKVNADMMADYLHGFTPAQQHGFVHASSTLFCPAAKA
jgi:hypothetical protein